MRQASFEKKSSWDVFQRQDMWYLSTPLHTDHYMIGPADMPQGIAIDAACEFMDRIGSSRLEFDHLMVVCVKNAYRQR